MDSYTAFMAVVVAALVALILFALVHNERADERCQARGGVYLVREDACVAGVPK